MNTRAIVEDGRRGKSGRGLPHSKTLARDPERHDCPQGFGVRQSSAAFASGNKQSSGIALVITLILLSVITFMAVTFLVVSRSEHGSVATTTDQTTARLANDAAMERALSQLNAYIMASSNEFNFDLFVSTNFINAAGFTPNSVSPTNVNYDYLNTPARTALSAADRLQNIANLIYDPRAPVFVTTNRTLNSNDFRVYLD